MGKVLKINEHSIFKIRIEEFDEFEESYFKDEYIKAAKALNDIIRINETDIKKKKEDEYNNIIAFIGERGTGKTSAMISFKNSLSIKNTSLNRVANKNITNLDIRENYKNIHNKNFEFLDTIDPSVFSSKESIVEIVVAQMFKKFKSAMNNGKYFDKQSLVQNFEKVYKDLRIINKEKHSIFDENLDNLEVLMDLSSAISLKNNLTNLISDYLKFVNQSNKESDYLVIDIDDLDMNICAGERMLEDIRKYLILPKVVILMATKIEQLEDVIKQKNIIDLSKLSNYYKIVDGASNSQLLDVFNNEINNKTQKYLEKIIPFSRRIYMPSISLSSVELKIELPDFKCSGESLGQAIAKQFRNRLDYLIITEDHWRAIIPNNLRGFISLIVEIGKLKDSKDPEDKKHNLKRIRDYFNNCLIENIKDIEKKEFLKEILWCYFKSINKKILNYINNIVFEKTKRKDNDDLAKNKNDIVKDISILNSIKELKENEIYISEDNVPLGYIVSWVKLYKKYINSDEEKKFIELLKGIYTIRLLHGYYYQSENLLSVTGRDFTGKYLEVNENKNYSKFEHTYKSTKKSITDLQFVYPKCSELDPNIYKNIETIDTTKEIYKFKSTTIVENNNISVLTDNGKKQFEEINNQLTAYYNILEIPYTEQNRRIENRLYRRETTYSNDWKFKANILNYKFKPLNIIGESFYKNLNNVQEKYEIVNEINNNTGMDKNLFNEYSKLIDSRIIFALNIDYFMKLLDIFELRTHNKRFGKNPEPAGILKDSIDYINSDFSKINAAYEIDGYQNIIDELESYELNFIKYNLSIVWEDWNKLILELKQALQSLSKYLKSKRTREGLTQFELQVNKKIKPIEELIKMLDLDILDGLKNILQNSSVYNDIYEEREAKTQLINDLIGEVDELINYVEGLNE